MVNKRWMLLSGVALLIVFTVFIVRYGSLPPVFAQNATPSGTLTPTPEPKYEGRITAPEFTFGLEWINVDQPLTMVDLRGKIVLLDFWTYGCINCIHIIPDLKRLEAEYPDELIVIGVHSAKFKNEGNTQNIREIVQRYEVTHPVVNDYDFDIWNLYNARAWPTLVLIDPAGKIIGTYAGEGVYDVFQPVIRTMVRQWDAKGAINRSPIKINPEISKRAAAPLFYPGKVLADPAGNRLFISDSNHHRIVVADLTTYEVKTLIGTGSSGLKDGIFSVAEFYQPQGLTLSADGKTLYVADTTNHAIRAIDFDKGVVRTVAGTGAQAAFRSVGGPGLTSELSSPWDVTIAGNVLYIAMAGPHQLWKLDLVSGQVSPHAGSGRESLVDAPLPDAQLAQPSGIIVDPTGKQLYFADSEASAIRVADVDSKGSVRTLVGKGLFDFGDVDGTGAAARLQHALGVTVGSDGLVYIADTYNHKIKVINPTTRETKTITGDSKEAALKDGSLKDARFNEPGGISYAKGKLYIADTNNDAIRVLDLQQGTVITVKFTNEEVLILPPPGQRERVGDPVSLASQTVAPGETQIVVNLTVPSAYKLNDTAPFELVVSPNPLLNVPSGKEKLSILKPSMPLTIPVTLKEGQTALIADADIYYCDAANERLCYVSRLTLTLPLTIKAGGEKEIALTHTVTPPKVPNSAFKQP
jgi:DNA-binding beta-propeller fold protein YncE